MRRSFKEHLELGREIKDLRERGVLILGSGNIVHNLRRVDWNNPHGAYDWAVEFDEKVKSAVEARDASTLATPQRWGESLLATAHPQRNTICRFYTRWARQTRRTELSILTKGFDFGSISMRAILFDAGS